MIDYKLLTKSQEYYSSKGFQILETPWTVTEDIANITTPKNADNWKIDSKDKVLVGSAEQGFLYLMNKGYLPKGKFQSIGPCFRSDSFSTTHTKYFVKNELIITDEVEEHVLKELVQICLSFFRSIGLKGASIKQTTEGLDIINNPHGSDMTELGSYGIRQHKDMKWIYGTGCPEPRTSRLLAGG